MPTPKALRDSPTPQSQLHSRPATPQQPQPSFPTATTTTTTATTNKDHEDEEERASLINEILRLEKSMNGALRASRDEMESLKDASITKKGELKRLEEEYEGIMKKIGDNGKGKQTQTRSGSGRRSSMRASLVGGDSHLRKSLIRQNSMLRRVSVSGDRPFFHRSSSKDELEGLRRRSDPVHPPSPSIVSHSVLSFRRKSNDLTCDDSSSSKGSRSSNNKQQQNENINSNDMGFDDDSNTNNDINKEKMKQHEKTLESKEQHIAELQTQKISNENQLSYLQSKLQSIQTQSTSRWEQHTSVVEKLHSRKQALSKSVERRERLIAEVEGCLEKYEVRIGKLEQEIEKKSKKRRSVSDSDNHEEHINGSENSTLTVSQIEEEIRKYQLRLKIHSQYTAKALESLLHSLDMAKKNDTDGLLFTENQPVDEDEDDDERRQCLIEEIALDVDIQLNNLDRMIKEVGGKVEEFKLLASLDFLPETSDHDYASNGDDNGETCDNDDKDHSYHPNQLLLLSKECADLLEDFVSTISKTMESTARTTPHSIEFQEAEATDATTLTNTANKNTSHGQTGCPPITSNANDLSHHNNEDEEELPYFQIQRKKLHLHELQRSQLQVNSNISMLQNDIQSFQTAMEQEKQAHYEMISSLQDKLRILMERLEGGGAELHALANELEETKEKEERLLKEFDR